MALLTNINGKFSVSDAGAVTFNNAFTFPTADGTANYVLKTNGSGQLAWAPDLNSDAVTKIIGGTNITVSPATGLGDVTVNADLSGTVTGTGTLNKVARWTATGSDIGDGPITFSNASATATSTFGGPVTSASVYGTSRVQSDDNMYMVGGQFYIGASDGTTDDTYRFYAASGVYYLQSRKSGTWTTYLSIGSDAHASFSGQVSATHFDSTSTTANIFLGSVITKPGDNLGFVIRNSSNTIIGSFLRTSNTASKLTTDNLALGGTTAQYVRGDGSFATYSPGTGTVTGTGANTQVAFWTGTSVIDGSSDLIWDNTNKELGIGTNPDYPLDVYRSSGTSGTSTGTTMQRLWNYVGADLSQQKTFIDFVFQDGNDNEYPQVRIGAEVGQNGDADSTIKEGSGAFVVYTNNATGSTPGTNALAERMRVDYSGHVGIGSNAPNRKLTVQSGSYTFPSGIDNNSFFGIANNSWSGMTLFSSTTTGSFIDFGDTDAGWRGRVLYHQGNDSMQFSVAAAERIRINSNGRTHITGPTLTLTSETTYGLSVSSQADDTKVTVIGFDTTNDVGVIQAVDIAVAWKNLALCPTSGNVGIGTPTPNTKLNIHGASAELNFTGSNNRIKFGGYRAVEGSHTGSLLQIGESYDDIAIQGFTLINTTTDRGGQLQVYTSDTTGSIRIGGGNNTGESRVYIHSGGNASYIDSFGDSTYKDLAIQAAVLKLQTHSAASSASVDIGSQNFRSYGSNPISKLNIEVNDSDAICIYNTEENDAYLRFVDSQSNGSQFAYFAFNSSTNYFTINNMGYSSNISNVGNWHIGGTSASSYRLQVTGTAYISGGVTFGGNAVVNNMLTINIDDISTGENRGLKLYNQNSTGQQWNLTTGITGQENTSFCIRDATNDVNAFTMAKTSGNAVFAGSVTAGGDVVAYSDERLKSNIKTLDGSKVLKMRGVSFDKDGKKGSGVIAQELEKIAPELVNNDSKYKSVAYGNITGYLIEAIKELKAEIEELKLNNCNCK